MKNAAGKATPGKGATGKATPGKVASAKAAPRKAAGRRPYHHGNLKQALVEACVELAEEDGAESVSVRKAARRIGVSSGAPFRHFSKRSALMTAVAEEGMRRFMQDIARGQNRASDAPPRERLRILAHTYILWALRNPVHFRIISSRELIDLEDSPALVSEIRAARSLTVDLLKEAGLNAAATRAGIHTIEVMARALVYGLSRMNVDGQMPQWDIAPADAERATLEAADAFIALLLSPA